MDCSIDRGTGEVGELQNDDLITPIHRNRLDQRVVSRPLFDPFAGGGSIPLEAQRLGMEAHAGDLNPVAVSITKTLIEIPPKLRAHCKSRWTKIFDRVDWRGARGLANDIRYYGKWMRDEAERRIGYLYPQAVLPRRTAEAMLP